MVAGLAKAPVSERAGGWLTPFRASNPRWHLLYFFPLPQGQGSFRPDLLINSAPRMGQRTLLATQILRNLFHAIHELFSQIAISIFRYLLLNYTFHHLVKHVTLTS